MNESCHFTCSTTPHHHHSSRSLETLTRMLGTHPILILQLVGVSRSMYSISSSYVRCEVSLAGGGGGGGGEAVCDQVGG